MIDPTRLALRASLPLYAGTGLLAAAMILYEVALTRIFSIAYGYHFAFLAISLGLLGFGVSGTLIALRPRWIERVTGAGLASLSLLAACSFIAGYLVANNIPFDPYRVGWAPGQMPLLAAYLASLAIPFLLIGLVLGLPLAAWPGSAGHLYGANLIGSGSGGLLALFILDMATAESALV
ncbi:MAG TPA: hypothetical protein VHJ40_08965, partial [Actinomycetota bacterium]|nr:hypothetical protein [Actinomycetota bacterium]